MILADYRQVIRRLSDYNAVDVLTYTFGHIHLSNIRRIVTSVLCEGFEHVERKELRLHKQNHHKLYLCYMKNRKDQLKLVTIFSGSMNCRFGYNENHLVSIAKSDMVQAREIFETIWTFSQPIREQTLVSSLPFNKQKHKTYGNP